MALARFLQVSDLHLGKPFGWLPVEKREQRRRAQRGVLERAVRESIERGVDALLIPGDLFDLEGVDSDTLAFVLGVFNVTGCPPVFIAPGNHDPYSEASPYWSQRLLEVRGAGWPSHVHVFRSPSWTALPLGDQKKIRVWGRCFISNVESLDRPLSKASLTGVSGPDAKAFDLAVFH